MKVSLLEKDALYLLKECVALRLHRPIVRFISAEPHGVIIWEDPKDKKRGYINARSLVSKIDEEELETWTSIK